MARKPIKILALVSCLLVAPPFICPAAADRLEELEKQMQELQREIQALKDERRKAEEEAKQAEAESKRKTNILAEAVDALKTQLTVPDDLELKGEYGMGPAASKIYRAQRGLSIGGYGEALFRKFVSDKSETDQDRTDFQRLVLYTGYKFNDWILFNSEVEFEHATTSSTESSSGGSVSVEFAYLDLFWQQYLNSRIGLVLVPMGFINEWHEPVFFYGVERPEVERQLIPTTWRENGAGIFGEIVPGVNYRAFAINSFNAKGIRPNGFRDARQQGNRALAEDFAFVGRIDYDPIPSLLFGGSVFAGDSGQGQVVDDVKIPSTSTLLWEVHSQYRAYGFQARALFAMANLGDARSLTLALRETEEIGETDTIAGRMIGTYLELAYDILPLIYPETEQSVEPFVRFEYLNTQDETPPGLGKNNNLQRRIWTTGVSYKPIPNVVLKVDYRDFSPVSGSRADEVNFGIGFVSSRCLSPSVVARACSLRRNTAQQTPRDAAVLAQVPTRKELRATRFGVRATRNPGGLRTSLGCMLAATTLFVLAARGEAKVFHAKSEALQLAFPDADRVETEIFYPTDEQVKEVERLARTPLDSKLVTFHVGHKGDQVLGYAFIETHVVRTLPETFLIVVSPAGVVEKLFVLAFYEPQEYLPSDRWLAQFHGKSLGPDVSLRGDIHGIAGATLTSRAVTSGVRKVLALFDVLVRGKS